MTKNEYLGYEWATLGGMASHPDGYGVTRCQIWRPDGTPVFDAGGWGFATGLDINGTVYKTLHERIEAAIRSLVRSEMRT